ncbi:coatomer subunit alpha [Physocladia obscura]|uniref:Coatomer subunit alpha n=1 Tax=Physocladia obscura TaxID=109957 RepID=A0AAD5TAH9_9FUNG|nr:coatomer subunit alpha [Physocladia obscura]
MISKSSLSPRDPGADFELAAVSADNSSIKEIDTMLLALIEKRKQLESNEKEIQLELLAEFLKKSKYEKEQELANLNEQISCINEDLQLVKMELNRSKPSQTSFENSAPKPVHNSFDFQHVPSTPISAQPTTTARLNMPVVAASSASVCSSPLPPELPGTVTPHAANMSSWNIPNSTLTTGSIFDALADEKNHHSGSRKRPHDKINDIDEQPPLEFTPFRQSTTADSSAMMTQLIRTRMSRVESHFPDLQNNYFSLRLGHQNNHKTMGSTGKLPSNAYQAHQRRDKGGNASHRTPSPSIPSSSASPLATGMRPFSETLSRFSKVSSFKTLARINYADKLVSGVGSSGGAAASGSSCIVSAIEFDADDRLFATAGVTKKIKIYEYESVVRDWGELFGGGSKQRREKARWLGGRKRAGLFVADALKDEDNDEDDSSDEDENDELFDDQNSRNFTEEVPRYPVLEMSGRSKISWLSWNSYIKSHLASSDYEGIVSLWDSNTGVLISEFEEHEKRTWSVDFNNVDPVLLASGSDDSKVKIWSTTQSGSVQTIDSKANICSVKWNPYSSHELAFGSADHHIHYYDLRNSSEPLHVLQGHRKAVSYVKFLSRNEIISASTDSTLKLWNLGSQGPPEPASVSATQSSSVSSLFAPLSSFIEANLVENLTSSIFRKSASSTLNLQKTSVRQTLSNLPVRNQHQYQQPQCMRSYSGHTNEKNFVGLSINSTGEFISCGSENNSVYTYFSSLSTPIINHRFGNAINTENGDEVLDPDPSHFVSSVCWMRKTADVLIAANSVGGVKVMQCV